MARSSAATVAAYLDELPASRRKEIERVRAVIRKRLPRGYAETMNWGMISYEIPLATYSTTYNKQPLAYAALAAQKNYNALYLMSAHVSKPLRQRLKDGFARAGAKLDMGKSCIRFQSADDLPLDAIGDIIASTPPNDWIAIFEKRRK